MSKPSPFPSLTPPMRVAAQSLASGASHEQAALDAHVSRRTIERWLQLYHFVQCIRHAYYLNPESQENGHPQTEFDVQSVKRALPSAVRELKRILDSPSSRDSAKIAAAKALSLLFDRTAELAELDERISELERDVDPRD